MAHKEVNAVTLTGQIAAEPEMRYTGEGEPFTRLTLHCRQPTGRDPHAHERFRLLARGEPLAEQCNDLLPNARVLVTGRLQSSTSDDPAERAQTPYEVLVREVLVLHSLPPEQPSVTANTASPPSRPVIARSPTPTRAGSAPVARASPPSAPRPGIPRGPRRNPSNA